MHRFAILIVCALFLAACGVVRLPQTSTPADLPETTAPPTPYPEGSWLPQPGDEKLNRAEVTLTGVELRARESLPVQYSLHLAGEKGNPCNQLRVSVPQPNPEGEIRVEVYTVYDIAATCLQILEMFEIDVPLDGPSGEFTIFVNGEPAGEVVFEGEGEPVQPITITDWQPQAGDERLAKGELNFSRAAVTESLSMPPTFSLELSGELPTPCYQVRAVVAVDEELSRINVDAYSLVDQEQMCSEVITPFSLLIPLEAPAGVYEVFLNGNSMGDVFFSE